MYTWELALQSLPRSPCTEHVPEYANNPIGHDAIVTPSGSHETHHCSSTPKPKQECLQWVWRHARQWLKPAHSPIVCHPYAPFRRTPQWVRGQTRTGEVKPLTSPPLNHQQRKDLLVFFEEYRFVWFHFQWTLGRCRFSMLFFFFPENHFLINFIGRVSSAMVQKFDFLHKAMTPFPCYTGTTLEDRNCETWNHFSRNKTSPNQK